VTLGIDGPTLPAAGLPESTYGDGGGDGSAPGWVLAGGPAARRSVEPDPLFGPSEPYANRREQPRTPAAQDTAAARRRLKQARGRTRGRSALQALSAAAGSVPLPDRALFGPIQLTRRQAVLSAAAAAGVSALAAVAAHGGDDPSSGAAAPGRSSPTATQGSRAGATSGPSSSPSASGSPSGPANGASAPAVIAADLDPEHLVRRVTYGATDAIRADVDKLGMAEWLGRQLEPSRLADPGGDAVAQLYPELAFTTVHARQVQMMGGDFYQFQLMLPLNHLGRAVWSSRQLHEVMVDFWSNHLNITAPGEKGSHARHRFDIDVIRANALGRYEDMLVASSVHPAMLDYLDNANSTKQQPNENYARELMELHTLGVHGGYTERDVKQAALLLTGWTIAEDGTAKYQTDRHYPKRVKILGYTYANGGGATGRRVAQQFVRDLANHPSTAAYLSRKLAIRFVTDDPPQALVDRLAQSYLTNKTAIAPVLRDLFASPEFAASGSLKVRRPMERLVAGVRTLGIKLGAEAQGLTDLYNMLDASGHKPLAWPMPNGYPDVASHWQSPAAALDQLNLAAALVHGWWPTKLVLPGPKKLLAKPPRNRTAVIDSVGKKVLGRLPTAQETSAAAALLGSTRLPKSFGSRTWEQEESMALTATLLLTSPDFLTR
jgi:uncharacterized protein (DUF1800 family)